MKLERVKGIKPLYRLRALIGCGNSKVVKSLTEHLRQGERVHILEAGESKPIQVSFVPLRYDELHDSIVPEEIRRVSGYWGYRPGPIHIAQRDGVGTARPHQAGVLLAK